MHLAFPLIFYQQADQDQVADVQIGRSIRQTQNSFFNPAGHPSVLFRQHALSSSTCPSAEQRGHHPSSSSRFSTHLAPGPTLVHAPRAPLSSAPCVARCHGSQCVRGGCLKPARAPIPINWVSHPSTAPSIVTSSNLSSRPLCLRFSSPAHPTDSMA